MPLDDIKVFSSPNGGPAEVRWGSMTTGGTFVRGEPIFIVDAGTLTEPGQDAGEIVVGDADSGLLGGIAAAGPGATNIDPDTGIAYAAGAAIPFYPFGEGTLFYTKNTFAAGAGSLIDPATTDVGEAYQMVYGTTAGSIGWGLERTAGVTGVDLVCNVVEILDASKVPVRISAATGEWFVFVVDKMTLAAA